jgi:hypothetical protein
MTKDGGKSARAARLAKALRENLKRRKAQARARRTEPSGAPEKPLPKVPAPRPS